MSDFWKLPHGEGVGIDGRSDDESNGGIGVGPAAGRPTDDRWPDWPDPGEDAHQRRMFE